MDFTYDSEQNALREAVRGLVGKAYADFEKRRQTVAEDPGFDEKLWQRLAEMGILGLPFAEEDGGMGAGPVEVGIVAAGDRAGARTRAVPRPRWCWPAAWSPRPGPRSRRRRCSAASPPASRCWPSRTPSRVRAGSATASSVTATSSRRRVDALRGQGAGAARRPRRRARGQRGARLGRDGPVRGRRRRDGLSRDGYPTHDGGRAARVSFADTPAEPLGAGGDAAVAIERIHDDRPHRRVQRGTRRDGGRARRPPRRTSRPASSSGSRSTRSRR